MSQTKVAITIEAGVLARVDALVRRKIFSNRSRAIQEAVQEKLERLERSRLAEECVKLDPAFEKAMALTSQQQRAGFPLTYEIQKSKLPKRSWVKVSQVRTLSTERIGRKIGSVDPEELDHVVEGLNEIVGN